MRRVATILGALTLSLGALASGVSASPAVSTAAPAAHPGWSGEQLFGDKTTDDWEPAVAADPVNPYSSVPAKASSPRTIRRSRSPRTEPSLPRG